MGDGFEAVRDGVHIAFDELKDLFFDTTTTADFLVSNTAGDDFDIVDFLESGWFLKYDAFRDRFQLEVAGVDADDITVPASLQWMQNTLGQATHVRVDDDIYVISKRDLIPPKGVNVTWKIFGTRLTKRGQFSPIL
jgi:hypothetical protein